MKFKLKNSKIPYRDPPSGLGDDRKSDPQKGIPVEFKLRNSKILKNSRIPKCLYIF